MNLFWIIYIIIFTVIIIIAGILFAVKMIHAKNFVSVFVFTPDGRLRRYFVKPDAQNCVSVDGMTFILDKENQRIFKGLPAYMFQYDNSKSLPIRALPKDENGTVKLKPTDAKTPAEVYTVLRSDAIQKLLSMVSSNTGETVSKVLLILTVVLVGVNVYLTFTMQDSLTSLLQQLNEKLSIITGIGG